MYTAKLTHFDTLHAFTCTWTKTGDWIELIEDYMYYVVHTAILKLHAFDRVQKSNCYNEF